MFFLFGTRTDFEDKEDVAPVYKKCPSCKEMADFREQVQVQNFHIFFIPLFTMKILDNDTQLYECGHCGKRFTLFDGQFGNIFYRFGRKPWGAGSKSRVKSKER